MENTPIFKLPTEILQRIARAAARPRDAAALARACRRLYHFIIQSLYTMDAEDESPVALSWASFHGMMHTADRALHAGTDVDSICDDLDWLDKSNRTSDWPGREATPFLLAAGCGHKELALKLLDAGADLEWMDCRNWTALYVAAKHGHEEMVRCLLRRTGDMLNLVSVSGMLPVAVACSERHSVVFRLLLEQWPGVVGKDDLFMAAKYGHNDVLHWLLEQGVEMDVDRYNNDNLLRTVCHGTTEGYVDIARTLLDAGVSVNSQRGEWTALHFACSQSGPNGVLLAKLLLEHGAKVNLKCGGYMPLHRACVSGNADVVELLLSHGAKPQLRSRLAENPLVSACSAGHLGIAERLMAHHSPPKLDEAGGAISLCGACKHEAVDVVQFLLSNGADPNMVDGHGRLPLHIAWTSCSLAVVEILLRAGADVKSRDGQAQTVLQKYYAKANEDQRRPTLELLLRHGANPFEADELGLTPLHRACEAGLSSCVQLLLNWHAEPGALDKFNRTPLYFAVQSGNIEAVKVLVAHGASPKEPRTSQGDGLLHSACMSKRAGQAQVIAYLLSQGVDPKAADRMGITPIYKLCSLGATSIELIKLLITHGADVNAETHDKSTVLHMVCRSGNYGAAKLLLEHKADPNAADSRLHTPLLAAVHAQSFATVRVLLSYGADPTGGFGRPDRPLARAVRSRCIRIAKLLIAAGADPHITGPDGATLLGVATDSDHPPLFRLLAGFGLDTNVVNLETDETPLHRAAKFGKYNMFRFLVESGIGGDVWRRDSSGATAIDLAVRTRNRYLSAYIKRMNTVQRADEAGFI